MVANKVRPFIILSLKLRSTKKIYKCLFYFTFHPKKMYSKFIDLTLYCLPVSGLVAWYVLKSNMTPKHSGVCTFFTLRLHSWWRWWWCWCYDSTIRCNTIASWMHFFHSVGDDGLPINAIAMNKTKHTHTKNKQR